VLARKKKIVFRCYTFLCPVDLAFVYNLENETNLAHVLFFVYFISIIYNLYMFRTSLGLSSGGTTVLMRHLELVILNS